MPNRLLLPGQLYVRGQTLRARDLRRTQLAREVFLPPVPGGTLLHNSIAVSPLPSWKLLPCWLLRPHYLPVRTHVYPGLIVGGRLRFFSAVASIGEGGESWRLFGDFEGANREDVGCACELGDLCLRLVRHSRCGELFRTSDQLEKDIARSSRQQLKFVRVRDAVKAILSWNIPLGVYLGLDRNMNPITLDQLF